MGNVTAGKFIDDKEAEEYRQGSIEQMLRLRCGGIIDNAFLEKAGYYHRPSNDKYKFSKGIWFTMGFSKKVGFTPIISFVNAVENVTEANVIGNGQDSKYPGL